MAATRAFLACAAALGNIWSKRSSWPLKHLTYKYEWHNIKKYLTDYLMKIFAILNAIHLFLMDEKVFICMLTSL